MLFDSESTDARIFAIGYKGFSFTKVGIFLCFNNHQLVCDGRLTSSVCLKKLMQESMPAGEKYLHLTKAAFHHNLAQVYYKYAHFYNY